MSSKLQPPSEDVGATIHGKDTIVKIPNLGQSLKHPFATQRPTTALEE